MHMKSTLLKNARIINENKIFQGDVRIVNGKIDKIASEISAKNEDIIEVDGNFLLPGLIDDQVHFREPGLTHKGNIASESRAAAAGGITTFMEMPNTIPNVFTQELLQDKYDIAAKSALVNYSFFMGASNDNLEEVLKTNPKNVCGIKVFMGSSTGNMLVDNEATLEGLFKNVPILIATHCEDEQTIRTNTEIYKNKYGEDVPMSAHPLIRSEEACYLSSSMAVALAKKYNTRLHILHISTAKEVGLFASNIPLEQKRITAEACVHHLWFCDKDYERLGSRIKWNPAVKKESDRDAILKGVLDGNIDVIATDHAPHTLEEKSNTYFKAPSGGPLVQHSLQIMYELYVQGKISLETIVQKMCHNPAILFEIENRGFIREGYQADLVILNPNKKHLVEKSNLLYHCGWSPFEGQTFSSSIEKTFVNGNLCFNNGKIIEYGQGHRLTFKR